MAGLVSTATIQPTAYALSSTIKQLGCSPNFPQNLALFTNYPTRCVRNRGLRRCFTTSMASNPLEICVKASITVPNKLGDCPFCQKVLLTLEEKHLPYDMKLVDLTNKPEWFLEINADGKVPVIKLEEKWIADSDVITQSVEEKYPNPPLATPPAKSTVLLYEVDVFDHIRNYTFLGKVTPTNCFEGSNGSKIFPTFIAFLKSKDSVDGTEQALLSELSTFNDYIKENGPFINGQEVSAADLSLGPKLYHLDIALAHYKNWSIPDTLPYAKSYTKELFSRGSFVKTRALPEDVIAGWRPKVYG